MKKGECHNRPYSQAIHRKPLKVNRLSKEEEEEGKEEKEKEKEKEEEESLRSG